MDEVRSVVSVRFSRVELEAITAAAAEAGQPLSTYIRNSTLVGARIVDVDAARKHLDQAVRTLAEIRRSLGE